MNSSAYNITISYTLETINDENIFSYLDNKMKINQYKGKISNKGNNKLTIGRCFDKKKSEPVLNDFLYLCNNTIN